MKDNKIISSHEDHHTLPDGTKLKISITNYEKRIFPLGDPYMAECRIDYVNMRGSRYFEYYANHVSEEEMKKGVDKFINDIKNDVNSYRHQFATK